MAVTYDPRQQARHPVSALAGPYGHPIHPILVTPGGTRATAATVAPETAPAERHPPVTVVVAHGLLAAIGIG